MAKLTDKQAIFVLHYVQIWNATEAARLAGYSENSCRQIGQQNLSKLVIQQSIKKRVAEVAMSADEVLLRLAEHARGSLAPFLTQVGDSTFVDLDTDSARANIHLLKKAKFKKRSGGRDEDTWTETEVEIELHDPQAALVHIGRHHKLFTDKSEVTGKDGEALRIIVEYVNDNTTTVTDAS